jgi:hypothetical protein
LVGSGGILRLVAISDGKQRSGLPALRHVSLVALASLQASHCSGSSTRSGASHHTGVPASMSWAENSLAPLGCHIDKDGK